MKQYAGRAVAFPLGGLGAGQVSLAADGSLTQWEIHNQVNHRGDVPETLFALRASCIEPPRDVRRVLRAAAGPADPAWQPAPLVTDHVPATWGRAAPGWEPVVETSFATQYPFARVDYSDPALSLDVQLEASTPFVPLDARASSLPLVVYRFSISNRSPHRQHGWLVSTLLNTVGWDGTTPIEANACALFGGERNLMERRSDDLLVVMDRPGQDADDPAAGSQAMWTDAPARALPRARSAADVLRWVDTLKLLEPTQTGTWDAASLRRSVASGARTHVDPVELSPPGQSWVGTLAGAYSLAAGETTDITFVHAWWFPNRVADFDQFGGLPPLESPTWLGNDYARPFGSALAVIDAWRSQRSALEASSRAWADAWTGTSLDDRIVETLAAQPALVRSPTIFVDAEGRAFGFEGGLGASTLNWNGDVGGSCPLNCTHVWNYEQALAGLFPSLERTMRATEWDHMLGADGVLPHRVRLPLDGPQLHGVAIGGPVDPALDGMLGAILKTWREARISGDRATLATYWPRMIRLMDHVVGRWDDGTGILRGRQPVTFDIDLTGPNMFVGSLWLAALRVMESVALLLGETAAAAGYRQRFLAGSTAYDALLWNGEYYAQTDPGSEHDFGQGCLSDQLIGQWWAHQLDLGHLLPEEHVRTALRSIVRHNLRHGFIGARQDHRMFADREDSGIVVCSWPRGGRPAVPVRYADEVWSGTEYQVAAHCLFEGLDAEASSILEAVRGRMRGDRRNPFNEIECGDHYARAMSGWSLLGASTGFRHDALTGRLHVSPAAGRYPFLTGSAWGVVDSDGVMARLAVLHGELRVSTVQVARDGPLLDLDVAAAIPAGGTLDVSLTSRSQSAASRVGSDG